MGVVNLPLVAFNRGLISKLALSRTDIARVALSAEDMTNWQPRVLGPMSLRGGMGYLGSTQGNAAARYLPFVFSTDDSALIELTDSVMRVWVNDAVITRPSVATTVVNGTFDTNLNNWTDADESGCVSQWATGGYMQLTGNGSVSSVRRQQVTVGAPSLNVQHAMNIAVLRGPVTFRLGSTSGGDEYIAETDLETGSHSLAFTPTGNIWIQFSSDLIRSVYVDSCVVASAGVMTLQTPWIDTDLGNVRSAQSADVLFIACKDVQQHRIERRGEKSWSVVLYQAPDGPFLDQNDRPISITPSGLSGNITLVSTKNTFKPEHVGAIWKLTSSGQAVQATITAEDTFTDPIEITGVGGQRQFTVIITGSWTATVTIQSSLESPGSWTDTAPSFTGNFSTTTANDGLDNQVDFLRIGVKVGDFTSGTINVELRYTRGSSTGVARITGYNSTTSVNAEVLELLGGTSPTDMWAEGRWSDASGWPTSVVFHEGRLWWAGQDRINGSVSDAFDSFDPDYEGDAGPIDRTIGAGPVDTINWLLSLQRMIVGAEGAEFSARSSAFDEPLTPDAFILRSGSTQGSAPAEAVRIDKIGIYVQRGKSRVYQIAYSADDNEYGSTDLTLLVPEVGEPSVIRTAVQRQPDTRIHCVRSDGKAAVLVFDPVENVKAWWLVETDGLIEDAVVLPDDIEDAVYYCVKRTINGVTKRYLERWAKISECVGGTLNKQADSFIVYSGSASSVITGLSHLEGESVVVWGNGADLGTKTVTGGQITGLTPVTSAVVGLPYTAQWKSTKLAYAAQLGTGLTQPKRIGRLGVIMVNTHAQGLKYGPDYTHLDPLPIVEKGRSLSGSTIHSVYDEQSFSFSGTWDTDSRLCLQAQAPRPCTLLAAIIDLETREKH